MLDNVGQCWTMLDMSNGHVESGHHNNSKTSFFSKSRLQTLGAVTIDFESTNLLSGLFPLCFADPLK